MAKISTLRKLIKGKRAIKQVPRFAKYGATGAAAGYMASAATAPAFGRHEAGSEGLRIGALAGAAAASIPIVGRAVRRSKAVRSGMTKGKVIFRRVRGRVVPIRMK